MKTKSAFINSKLFTVFLVAGLIAFIQGAPVFAQSFASPTTYPVGTQVYDGDLGDFNGDGKPDLAVANNITSNISVLLGNGDGTHLGPRRITTLDNPLMELSSPI